MEDRGKKERGSVLRLERFELPTTGLEIRCSIQLSYRREGNNKIMKKS